MSFDKYEVLTGKNLFLQIPLLDLSTSNLEKPLVNTKVIYDLLQEVSTQDAILDQRRYYRHFIQIASFARDVITTELNKINTNDDLLQIYQFWEIRLTCLLFANELQLSQQESKRLSIALDGIVKLDETTRVTTNTTQQILTFPKTVPLSLKFLLIRLRSCGPGLILLNEYYSQLWEFRNNYYKLNDEEAVDKGDKLSKIIKILGIGISASLIAKREFSALLTHSDSIIDKIVDDDDKDSTINSKFKDQISFIATIVSLIKGDWDLANTYFNKVQNLSPILKPLETVLNSVSPVLDNKVLKEGDQLRITEEDKIKVQDFKNVDDLFESIKEQLITGRTLCSLCATFELELRSLDERDIFSEAYDDLKQEQDYKSLIFKLWHHRTTKLYAFE